MKKGILQLFQRRRMRRESAEDIEAHIEEKVADLMESGLSEPEALQTARREFGNATLYKEISRETWSWTFWETLAQDVRYGLRTLAANRGFAATAVLSLALGIGANTAIFSILNAVMLRSLPVEDPHQLVELRFDNNAYFTNPVWEQVRDHQQAFSGTLAYGNDRFDLADGGESQYAQGLWVSGDFFRVLGVPAMRGRMFTPEDDRHGGGSAGPVAVISYSFWKGHFGGDPNVLGKIVSLDRHKFEVVGVSPPWFTGLDVDQGYDVAIPIGCEPLFHTDQSALNERSWWWLRVLGRLTPGETLPQAEAHMKAIAPEIARATLPPNWNAADQKGYLGRSFTLRPAATGFSETGTQYRTALFTLMALVALVLLIACANVANLLLARAAARHREIAVRLAIGAARSRIIRQLLTESLLLSFAGAAGGLLFAVWGSQLLVQLLSTTNNQLQLDVSPDLHLLAFTAGVAILTGLLFGLAPALRATKVTPNQILKENARGAVAGSSRFTLGKGLVTGQVALSLVLLVGAGLFLGTLRNLTRLDPGFNSHNVLLVQAGVPELHIQKPLRLALFDTILTRLRVLRGVRSAASSGLTPISRNFWNQMAFPEGYTAKSGPADTLVFFNRVSPGYFQTMGTSMLMGRDFSERDTVTSPKVIIIAESAARQFWGAANPVGKTIGIPIFGAPGKQDRYEVVGVVKDIRYGELNEKPVMTAYLPTAQDLDPAARRTFELRFDGPIEALTPAVRQVFADANREAALEFRSFEVQVDDSLMQQRLVAILSSFFGILALLLAVIGLYGVIAYATARRRGEIGIRMALGAPQRSVIWLVLRDVMLMLAVGIALGLGASVAAGRLITSLLYGVKPSDSLTLATCALILGAAATIAGYLPARRAAKMDPMTALRDE